MSPGAQISFGRNGLFPAQCHSSVDAADNFGAVFIEPLPFGSFSLVEFWNAVRVGSLAVRTVGLFRVIGIEPAPHLVRRCIRLRLRAVVVGIFLQRIAAR
ncbi:MAG: hypothetical protein ACRD1V_03405 [Vicinamibacterales bacterium]